MGKSAKIRHRRRRRQVRRWAPITAKALKETLEFILDEMVDYQVDWSKWLDTRVYP